MSVGRMSSWRPARKGSVLTLDVHPGNGEFEHFEARELWKGATLWHPGGTNPAGTWVEGAATFDGAVVGSSWDLTGAHRWTNQGSAFRERWAREAHGSAACWTIDAERDTVHIYPDFFGGCSVFIADFSPGLAIATSLRQLELLAEAVGRPLRRSPEFQAERILLGNGGLWPTSFTNVRRLEQAHFISVEGTLLRVLPYDFRTEIFDRTRAVGDVMAAVRADVQANVRAIAASEVEHRVAHLTGGFDSRLVLSAILDQELQERFVFFTSGAVGATDRTIADGLARQYGLVRTNDPGLSPAAPRNVRERFLAPMRWSAGILGSGPTGRERPQSVLAAGGGYGELLRSFFRHRLANHSRTSAPRDVLGRLWPSVIESRMCRPDFVAEVSERLSARLAAGEAAGIPEHFDLDFFYLSIRNRYHIGMNAYLWSSVSTRLDPLYSPHLLSLGIVAERGDRLSNVHGFRLMDSFAPLMRHHPFDQDRYDDHSRRILPPLDRPLPSEGPIRWRKLPSTRPRAQPPLVQSTPAERDALVRRSNAMGLNFWQLQWLPTARQALRRALRETDGAGLDSVLQMDYVRHLATGEVRQKSEIRDVYTCLEALLWLSH